MKDHPKSLISTIIQSFVVYFKYSLVLTTFNLSFIASGTIMRLSVSGTCTTDDLARSIFYMHLKGINP